MSTADDLGGRWSGMFNYPRGLPATAFEAVLRDANGSITGETSEADIFDPGVTRLACLDGRRDGHAVRWSKLYDGEGEYDIVAYEGRVADDRLEITGRWSILGVWSGTFIMTRDTGVLTTASREVGETVR